MATWVIDPDSGAGYDFTDIVAAYASGSVASGDTFELRDKAHGAGGGSSISSSKDITFVASSGAEVDGVTFTSGARIIWDAGDHIWGSGHTGNISASDIGVRSDNDTSSSVEVIRTGNNITCTWTRCMIWCADDSGGDGAYSQVDSTSTHIFRNCLIRGFDRSLGNGGGIIQSNFSALTLTMEHCTVDIPGGVMPGQGRSHTINIKGCNIKAGSSMDAMSNATFNMVENCCTFSTPSDLDTNDNNTFSTTFSATTTATAVIISTLPSTYPDGDHTLVEATGAGSNVAIDKVDPVVISSGNDIAGTAMPSAPADAGCFQLAGSAAQTVSVSPISTSTAITSVTRTQDQEVSVSALSVTTDIHNTSNGGALTVTQAQTVSVSPAAVATDVSDSSNGGAITVTQGQTVSVPALSVATTVNDDNAIGIAQDQTVAVSPVEATTDVSNSTGGGSITVVQGQAVAVSPITATTDISNSTGGGAISVAQGQTVSVSPITTATAVVAPTVVDDQVVAVSPIEAVTDVSNTAGGGAITVATEQAVSVSALSVATAIEAPDVSTLNQTVVVGTNTATTAIRTPDSTTDVDPLANLSLQINDDGSREFIFEPGTDSNLMRKIHEDGKWVMWDRFITVDYRSYRLGIRYNKLTQDLTFTMLLVYGNTSTTYVGSWALQRIQVGYTLYTVTETEPGVYAYTVQVSEQIDPGVFLAAQGGGAGKVINGMGIPPSIFTWNAGTQTKVGNTYNGWTQAFVPNRVWVLGLDSTGFNADNGRFCFRWDPALEAQPLTQGGSDFYKELLYPAICSSGTFIYDDEHGTVVDSSQLEWHWAQREGWTHDAPPPTQSTCWFFTDRPISAQNPLPEIALNQPPVGVVHPVFGGKSWKQNMPTQWADAGWGQLFLSVANGNEDDYATDMALQFMVMHGAAAYLSAFPPVDTVNWLPTWANQFFDDYFDGVIRFRGRALATGVMCAQALRRISTFRSEENDQIASLLSRVEARVEQIKDSMLYAPFRTVPPWGSAPVTAGTTIQGFFQKGIIGYLSTRNTIENGSASGRPRVDYFVVLEYGHWWHGWKLYSEYREQVGLSPVQDVEDLIDDIAEWYYDNTYYWGSPGNPQHPDPNGTHTGGYVGWRPYYLMPIAPTYSAYFRYATTFSYPNPYKAVYDWVIERGLRPNDTKRQQIEAQYANGPYRWRLRLPNEGQTVSIDPITASTAVVPPVVPSQVVEVPALRVATKIQSDPDELGDLAEIFIGRGIPISTIEATTAIAAPAVGEGQFVEVPVLRARALIRQPTPIDPTQRVAIAPIAAATAVTAPAAAAVLDRCFAVNVDMLSNRIKNVFGIELGMTETERDAMVNPQEGTLIYNTTAGQLELYDGGLWSAV